MSPLHASTQNGMNTMSRLEFASSSIDEQLGAAHSRYFGAGFSNVQHTLDPMFVAEYEGNFRVRVSYPDEWSIKGTNSPPAHLSSIDAMVIAARMVENWAEGNGLVSHLQYGWLSRCELKPGPSAVEVSAELPATLTLESKRSLRESVDELCFSCLIDSFTVLLRVHLPRSVTDVTAEALGASYFATGYQEAQRKLERVTLLGGGHAECTVSIECQSEQPASGLEAEHGTAVSFVDATLIAAQIGQVLIYDLDQMHRDETETLWLRRATFERSKPPEAEHFSGTADVRLAKTNRIARGTKVWRSADFTAQINDVHVRYSLVHELPAIVQSDAIE